MTELVKAKAARLESLDVFRGMTIAGMVLVNNPGTWGAMYQPLTHAQWDGCTPTDLIFPFFMFIVGVAMTFSLDRRLAAGGHHWSIFAGVVKRALFLIFLGLILTGFPNFRMIGPLILAMVGMTWLYRTEPIFSMPTDGVEKNWKIAGAVTTLVAALWFILDFGHFTGPNKSSNWADFFPLAALDGGYIRVPGVLQRIGLAFFLASLIMMFTRTRGRVIWAIVLMVGYWLLMRFVSAPEGYTIGVGGGKGDAPVDAPFLGVLNDWIDVKLLGRHLYNARPDPEGLLSTIPAVATVLLGMLTGTLLHRNIDGTRKCLLMAAAGVPLIVLGLIWDLAFPINKKIWSSSYVVYTAGWGLLFLSFCYYLNDVLNQRLWSKPFMVFGTNPILVFFGSGLMARIMSMIKWQVPGEGDVIVNWTLKTWIYKNGFESWLGSGKLASAAFAIAFIGLWLLITYPLYRKKIFLKV